MVATIPKIHAGIPEIVGTIPEIVGRGPGGVVTISEVPKGWYDLPEGISEIVSRRLEIH